MASLSSLTNTPTNRSFEFLESRFRVEFCKHVGWDFDRTGRKSGSSPQELRVSDVRIHSSFGGAGWLER